MTQAISLEYIRATDDVLDSTPRLKDLYTLITPNYAAHWNVIGTLLGIPKGRLDGIESGFPTNVFWCCNRMLKMWLEMNTSATWKDVIAAIDSPAILPHPLPALSEDVTVHIIEKLSDHVKTNYIKTRYFCQEGIWYHLSPRHFVNVLLIHHMEQRGEKEIVDIALLMREGLASSHQLSQSDKTQSVTISTHDISDIFKPFKKTDGTYVDPEVIIIDGAPGMGKTTLCKEIAYRWAKFQLLNDIKVVFFIYLRDPDTQKIYDLQSFIHYFHNFDQAAAEFSKQCANILINRSNEDIAIILDGYDEIFHASAYSFIYRIVHRAVLARCKLIIASRPTATDKLQHVGDIRVEVMGFTDDSKKEYIEQELKNFPEKIRKLFSYLADHEAINSICYIPMIMTILVCTFREFEELPSDETELYEKFLTLAITRYVEKLQVNPKQKILPLNRLPELYSNHLFELSKFAFYNLKDDKIVFTQEDIEKYCPMLSSANNHFEGLGLLKSAKYFSMKNIDNCLSYNFLHLSIQEYLAAYYIKLLPPCKQFELIKDFFFVEKYTNTWTMFAELSKKAIPNYFDYLVYGMPFDKFPCTLNLNPFQAFCQVIQICVNDHSPSSTKLLCFKNNKNSSFDKTDTHRFSTNVDCLSLLNKLNFTDVNLNKLYLSMHSDKGNILQCFVMDKNMEEVLYSKIASHLYANKQLSIVIVNVSTIIGYRANKQQISDGLAMNSYITNLIFRECCIDSETAEIISSYVKRSNMILVAFDNCTFCNSSDKVIFKGLSFLTSLKFLIINRTYIGNAAINSMSSMIENNIDLHYVYLNHQLVSNAFQIVSALKTLSTIRNLNLSNNNIPNHVAEELAHAIIANPKLQTVVLANNNLHNGGILVASALCRITSLTSLNLSNNNMTEEVADHLAMAFENNKSIEELGLGRNNLKTNGIIKVAKPLHWMTNLRVLDISDNQVTEGAADAISLVISKLFNLEQLCLGNNKLGAGSVNVIAALKSISKLKVLDLNDNNMPVDVATELASAIVHNSSLESLKLSGNRLGTSCISFIAAALCNISTLKLLDIRNNFINEKAVDSLSLALRSNAGIEELYLGYNKLGAGAIKIVRALKDISSLKVLDLNNNNTSGIIADELAAVIERNGIQTLGLANNNLRSYACAILHSSSKITTITNLDLSSNGLAEGTAAIIASVIASNTTLSILRLNDNRLTTSGIVTVARSLTKISSLKFINVQNNLITEEAADAIASVIKSNTGIEKLYLGNNKLGAGTLKILRALKDVTSLKVLDLNNNNTSGVIADELAAVIERNSLQKLWLANNDLRSSVRTFLKPLSRITTIEELDLSGNDMSEEIAVFLASVLASNTSLEGLRLHNNRLTTNGIVKIARYLSNISSLKYLSVKNNLITGEASDAISSVIRSNTGIEELYLGNNKLGAGALKIVRALKDVSSLKVLDLNNNNTSGVIADELAAVIECNSLQKLWLANNNLQMAAGILLYSLRKISTLRSLDLSGNDIPQQVAVNIASAIASNSSLEGLRLHNNRLTTKGIVTIARSLSKLSSLKYLCVQNNLITEEAADAIASLINSNTRVELLYLGNNRLEVGALKIVRALKNVSSLKMLDLNNNNTSGVIADELAAVIERNSLQKLWLANNNLGSHACVTLLSLSKITTLIELNLSGNNLSKEVAISISSAITSNCSIVSLILRNNKLATIGFVAIAKSLTKLSTLKILNMQSNLITEQAADAIASVIQSNNAIEELYLGNNKLGAGALKILRALKGVSSLRVLDLNNNNTSGLIADDLAAVIECNSLQILWLANNDLGSNVSKILQSLSKITTLLELNLSANNMSEEVSAFLASVITSNSSLQSLRLHNNRLTTSGIVTIAESSSKISSLKHFTVNSNLINDEAVDGIVSVISNNNKLEYLGLGDNNFESGTCKIVAFLHNSKTLKGLELDNIDMSKILHANNFLESCLQSPLQFLCKISTLKRLWLGGCNITGEIVKDLISAIKSNCSMELLQLKNNHLTTEEVVSICQSLQQLSTLKHFNIRNNRITGEAAESIALVIKNNNQMQSLYVGDNRLHNTAVTIIRTLQSISSLVVLHLSNLKMTEEVACDLVVVISCNPLLEELYLAGNLLSTSLIEVTKACKEITKHLSTLDLQCNSVDPSVMINLTSEVGDIVTLEALLLGGSAVSVLEKFCINFMQHLDQLHLCNDTVDQKHQKYQIIEILCVQMQILNIVSYAKLNYDRENTSFEYADNLFAKILNLNEEINLHMNFKKSKQTLSDVVSVQILHSLSIISSLKVLDLEHSNITESAASELATNLHSNNVLEQLWLRGNQLNTAGAILILRSLEHISTLKVLDFSFNNIGYQSADNIAAVIYSNPTLEQLWLDGNGLLDTGVIQICRALKHVNKLRVLSLCSNGISDDSAEELSAAISSNDLLEDLLLSNNNLQHVGICTIVHSLNNLVRLRKLDLFHNGVTAEAADELAVTISNSYTLQELYLSDNMLGTTGAVKILKSFKHKSKLQVLTLSNNNITDEAIVELSSVLTNNPRLQVLLIGGNKLQTDGVITIAGVVKCENTIMHLLALCENDVSEEGKEQVKMMFSDNPEIYVYM